jgi:hypothetical protein
LEIRFRKQFSLDNNNNNSTARWMLRIILPKSTTLLVAHYYWDQTSWRFKQMISSYIQIFCYQQQQFLDIGCLSKLSKQSEIAATESRVQKVNLFKGA